MIKHRALVPPSRIESSSFGSNGPFLSSREEVARGEALPRPPELFLAGPGRVHPQALY